MNYINDEHTQCAEAPTRELVKLLQKWGWDVEYGTGPSWTFESDGECDDFYTDFDKAFNSVTNNVPDNQKENHQLIHQSKSNEWYTPPEYIEAARAVMGSIDLDPASCEYANQTVMAGEFFDKEEDGFTASWFGNVWLNPPYGRDGKDSNQSLWSNKVIAQYKAGAINQAILLVSSAIGTAWFNPLFEYPICFPEKRIHFINKDGNQSSPTIGNAFVYLGKNINKFVEVFSQFGTVVMRQV